MRMHVYSAKAKARCRLISNVHYAAMHTAPPLISQMIMHRVVTATKSLIDGGCVLVFSVHLHSTHQCHQPTGITSPKKMVHLPLCPPSGTAITATDD